jgi:hypothetical protein
MLQWIKFSPNHLPLLKVPSPIVEMTVHVFNYTKRELHLVFVFFISANITGVQSISPQAVMTNFSVGLPPLVPNFSILRKTSNPANSWPKTTCLLSSLQNKTLSKFIIKKLTLHLPFTFFQCQKEL